MTISPNTLEMLIRVGKQAEHGVDHAPGDLEGLHRQRRINCLHWRDWDSVTASMSLDDVVAMARALTVCEERFRWVGGSVSAVIWVFREVDRRDSARAAELADWILARTSNPWAPFGSRNLGARSVHEHAVLQEGVAARRVETARLEAERSAAGKRKREERKQAAVLRLAAQIKATATRRVWVQWFLALPRVEQLRRIAQDREHPLDYFPSACAFVDVATLESLDDGVRLMLIDRLKDRRKGPWKQLLLALRSTGS